MPAKQYRSARMSEGKLRRPCIGCLTILAVLVFCLPLLSQNPQLETRNGRAFPTVVFTSVQWNRNPPFHSIAMDSTGDLTYESLPDSTENTGDPYTMELEVADSCRPTVFTLIQRLHFLAGQFRIANSSRAGGTVRTLTFREGNINHQITFTSSADPGIQELTSIFEKIGATFEFARRLTNAYPPGKGRRVGRPRARGPSLESELMDLQNAVEQQRLLELQAVSPILTKIESDAGLPEEVRQRAHAILILKASTCTSPTQ